MTLCFQLWLDMPLLTDETPETVSRRFEDARNSSPFFERESFGVKVGFAGGTPGFGAALGFYACIFEGAVCTASFLDPRE